MSKNALSFSDILKFNPYHDSLGRFTTSGAATSFTYRPGASKAHDMAIAREKERTKNMATAAGSRKESFKERERKRQEEYRRNVARFDERVKTELPGIDQDAVRRANDVSMFDHGSVSARQALSYVDEYKRRNPIQDDWTDEQKAYAQKREEEYKQLVTDYINDSNRRFAENPGWHITGPANYNVSRHNKKMEAAQKKEQEYRDKMDRFEENTKKGLERLTPEGKQIERWRQGKWKHGETISDTDPLATKKQQAKIDYLKEANEKAKAANRYWNKNHDMTGFDGFSEETNQKLNAQFSRIYQNTSNVRNPFSTNSAEIRAAEKRLTQLQQIADRRSTAATAGSSTSGGVSFKGGTMQHNAEINRLQLVFDGKPSAEVRAKLKSNGFRWSPSQNAWQRQDTPNAERAAQRIMDELNKSYPYPVTKEPRTFSDVIKFNPYHGSDGRFTGAGSAASFTYKPGASTAHSKAIEREKARTAGTGFSGTLYHGSPATDIKEFDMKLAGKNTSSGEKLLFFTDSKQMADDFSYERLEGSSKYFQQRGKKGRVYEVDVNMKKPLDFRNLSDQDIDNILKLDEEGTLTRDSIKSMAQKNHQLLKVGLNLTSDSLKSLGYDGLIANTGKAGHNSYEYAVVDSSQAKIRKARATDGESVIFIGLHLTGVPENLLIDGGEDEKDLHVTLLYGYFEPRGDEDDTQVRIQSALEKVRPLLPDTIRFDRIDRFPASASSDGKDVIYARVAAGQLEKAHDTLIRELKRQGIKVQQTFDVYKPHMTLAYIDQGEDFPLGRIRATAAIDKIMIGNGADSDESRDNTFYITKTDDDKRLVFGWANVAIRKNGEQIKDWQNDMIDPEDLEEAVYKYVLNFRNAGEEHIPTLRKKGRLVESVMFTEEKLKAMGIPLGTVPLGWWIGFYVDDDAAWEKIKSGHYKMFSVEGRGIRQVMEDDD